MNQDDRGDTDRPTAREEGRERVLRYLYDAMTAAERTAFEIDCERDADLQSLLVAERGFDAAVPVGSGAQISNGELADVRSRLRLALDVESRGARSIWSRLVEQWRALDVSPTSSVALGAACAAVLLLVAGVFLGRTVLSPAADARSATMVGTATSLIDADELEITDLRVTAYEPESGRIALSFDAATHTAVEGNMRDEAVRRLLASALHGGMRPSARLRTVELLGAQSADDPVREALMHALLHDENPGVRLAAVSALKELAANDQVRAALRAALLDDLNPGVRVEAIEVLRDYRDPATLEVLRRKMQVDGNEYIRSEAGRAVEKWAAEATEQL